jgi:hypothetical protein
MLIILFLTLAALGGAAPAVFVTYRVAYRRGQIWGVRYGARRGVQKYRMLVEARLTAEQEEHAAR